MTFTVALLLVIPLALLAMGGLFWPAVAVAAVCGPLLAWIHQHL